VPSVTRNSWLLPYTARETPGKTMRPELIQASELLQRNTPESVEQAVALLQNTVYSFSMKICGHREDAEDTMQDVLFRSLKYLSKIQDPNALAAWLYTVTRNRCRRMRRGPQNSQAKRLSLDELMPDEQEMRELLQRTERGPELHAIHAEQQHLLHRAVLALPSPLRLVLVLHDMEELTSEQVAQILGLQVGTVRVRLHRARLAIRKQMARLLEGLPEPPQKPGKPLGHRPKECRDLFAGLSEYVDGRIEPRTCEQMRVHIEACPACIAFLKDLRATVDRCRSLDVPCDADIVHRMRSLITREYMRLVGDSKSMDAAAR
jgi:RNA polymerase sigma-70 factor, ECF subfamily